MQNNIQKHSETKDLQLKPLSFLDEIDRKASLEMQEQWKKQTAGNDHFVEELIKSGFPKRQLVKEVIWDEPNKSYFEGIKANLGKGFIYALVGLRGIGKTQMAVDIAKHHKMAYKAKLSRFCSAMDFFIDLKSSFRRDSESEKDVLARYSSPSLLVIDEIQERGSTDWENSLLTVLINKRYQDQKDTILIGNILPSNFPSHVGDSISSRMNECGGIIELKGSSWRKSN